VVVDASMRTSDPDILACGDVAEHAGAVTGRWPTAVEQGTVAAVSALGGHRPYAPLAVPTKLKVSGVTLNAVGETDTRPGLEELVDDDPGARWYRKLLAEDGRLVGAVVFGDATGWDDLVAAVRERRDARSVLAGLRAVRRSSAAA
jgi:nitrite reductase (NADH) large subunit